MTTATDWDVTDTDTGSHPVVTDVTSAATPDAPVRVGGWTPNPDYYIPDHVATLLRPLTREQLDAEDTPQAGDHVPGTDDLTKRIDLTMASYRLMRHQQIKAELWHAEASRLWAEQGVASRVSERYTDRREALLSAYQAEHDRLVAGLDHTPYPAYMAALPAFVRGNTATVATERHTSVYAELAPDRIADDTPTTTHSSSPDAATTPGPRPEVEAMARRDKERRQREQRATTAAQADTPAPAPEPERRGRLRRMWDAIRTWDGSGA